MNWPRFLTFSMVFGFLGLLVTGCGSSGPQLGEVSGTVTFDGQPLDHATVVFKPTEGRESAGVTDATGHYELGFAGEQMGAIVGSHKVRIIPATEDDNGNPLPNAVRLPKKYNEDTELTADVKSGDNTCNFDLESS